MGRPWETLASVPTAEGPLALLRRGEKDFLVTINGRVLMNSVTHRSEDALGRLACAGLKEKPKARVLVSGLGMGFTLAAVLDVLSADAEVAIAELNPIVVDWCKDQLAPLIKDAARDPRVTINIVDVAVHIAGVAKDAKARKFDAIVLDMYEGPQTRVHPNDPLYGPAAVRRTKQAMTATGTLGVWCEGPSTGYEQSLKAAGLKFRLERIARGARTHFVYLAHN